MEHRRRFATDRLDGLYDEPRPGTPHSIGDDEIADTIRRTLEETPRDATHWSLRSMAQAGASWINQVERFFTLVTEKKIRRGIHRSTEALEADLRAFIVVHNEQLRPFRWTRSANDILQAVKRFYLRTIKISETSESGH